MKVTKSKNCINRELIWRDIGLTQYLGVWEEMQRFTNARVDETVDELWFTEHHPVFTLGQAGKTEHILIPENVEVVHSDRGGQVTYHGPGQLVAYLLCDIKRRKLGVHQFVRNLEQVMIQTLSRIGIDCTRISGVPGVYVSGKKIGALGLRIRKGCSYHGISLNVAMDLEPFTRINPCGLVGMQVTQVSELVDVTNMAPIRDYFTEEVKDVFDYRSIHSLA